MPQHVEPATPGPDRLGEADSAPPDDAPGAAPGRDDVSHAETAPMPAPSPHGPEWTPPPRVHEFRLERLLGRGAMGVVYLGHDTLLDRPVAVKFILGVESEPRQRRRFLVEARAVARLAHPNVVTLYRAGEIDGHPYLVSEFIRGDSLADLKLPIPWLQALQLGVDLCRGLAAAHGQGVMHRDLKPANAILAQGGPVKLLDFGLAKLTESQGPRSGHLSAAFGSPGALSDEASQMTQAGALVGTPRYMAPEVWLGQEYTPRCDVYSLGAMLYQFCAGVPPHTGTTLEALSASVTSREPVPLSQAAPTVPVRLGALVDACLRLHPDERPASAQELLVKLEALQRAAQRPPRRWQRRAAGGLALGLVGAAAVWGLGQRAPGPVRVPGGVFQMGSDADEIDAAFRECARTAGPDECERALFEREQPLRQVRLSPYRIDATEVTNRGFAAWLNRLSDLRVVPREVKRGETESWVYQGDAPLLSLYPSYPSYGLRQVAGAYQAVTGYEDRPVSQVTWYGAQRYCQARGGRLPTEAEWEYAARARPDYRFPWGLDKPQCDGVVFGRLPGQECAGRPAVPGLVGRSRLDRTPRGVYDLGGNVAEWVLDRFTPTYQPCAGVCEDPVVDDAPPGGGPGGRAVVSRVYRGGDWAQVGIMSRSAGRARLRADSVLKDLGFRCVLPGG